MNLSYKYPGASSFQGIRFFSIEALPKLFFNLFSHNQTLITLQTHSTRRSSSFLKSEFEDLSIESQISKEKEQYLYFWGYWELYVMMNTCDMYEHTDIVMERRSKVDVGSFIAEPL